MTDQLPRYRSHKIVGAARIKSVDHDHRVITLELPDGKTTERPWLPRFTGPYTPNPGMWYVEYPESDQPGDVFASISPGNRFEEGYSLVEEPTSDEPAEEAAGAKVGQEPAQPPAKPDADPVQPAA
jgi:hypothetical protein